MNTTFTVEQKKARTQLAAALSCVHSKEVDLNKPAHLPWETLGMELCLFIPISAREVCIVCDCALLTAALFDKRQRGWAAKIRFIYSTPEQLAFAKARGLKNFEKASNGTSSQDDELIYASYNGLSNQLKTIMKKYSRKFDVVLMNPPYEGLWAQFARMADAIVKEGGIVGAVTPTNWTKTSEPVHDVIFANEILSLQNDVRQKHFPQIGEMIGVYVYRKIPATSLITKIIGVDGVEYMYDTTKFMVPRGLDAVSMEIIEKVIHSQPLFEAVPSNYKDKYEDRTVPSSVYKNHQLQCGSTIPLDRPGVPKVLLSRRLRRYGKQRTMVTFKDQNGEFNINDGFYLYCKSSDEVQKLSWCIAESKIMRYLSGLNDKSPYLSPDLRKSIPLICAQVSDDESFFKIVGLSEAAKQRILSEVV